MLLCLSGNEMMHIGNEMMHIDYCSMVHGAWCLLYCRTPYAPNIWGIYAMIEDFVFGAPPVL
jgi:hypothetical protein